ncbi:universal stress protein [Taklimakanibacter lacteus]|uniref:universal stress protein n=1 Tax=Taklimakanibacter lacteus TaxID=2268456 RepID=UPI000E67663F
MLKNALVLVADTASSAVARRYAISHAKKAEADIAGLAGIDFSHIEDRMLGRAGTSAYRIDLGNTLRKQAAGIRQRMHDVFQAECRENHILFNWLSFEGDPVDTVQLAAETRDLIVAGHDTGFCGEARQPVAQLLGKLLIACPRPVIVCPDEMPAGNEILIAYDGSPSAMRAVQMFALGGIGQDGPICVTSIDADQETATRRTVGAAAYLRGHGYKVTENPITSRVHPAEVLRIEVADRKVGLLVMGAYGHRGLHEIFFGSTTSSLVNTPPCVLFFYH